MTLTANSSNGPTRREFLYQLTGTIAACTSVAWITETRAAGTASKPDLIDTITRTVLWPGRREGYSWFHPRVCMIPGPQNPLALMTTQKITGSDYYHAVHCSVSSDLGKSWTEPEPIPRLGRRTVSDTVQEGVCDVVPDYHPLTRTVLAIGHNVWYRNGRLMSPQRRRFPVYVVRRQDGTWSEKRILEWIDNTSFSIYTCGCGQRVTLSDDNLIIPFSLGFDGRNDRVVVSALCTFDGNEIRMIKIGNELTNKTKRGLLEPSMISFNRRYYMTIRAEDNRGYVCSSDDGLHWSPPQPWRWLDGSPLSMSTTQQHWLVHNEGLFLVYTRKAEANINVFRWRAPLYIAAVDVESLRLIKETERIVLPLIGDGIRDAGNVARMGNFHTTNATADESWVTVGECLPGKSFTGDTLLARIHWSRPKAM
ncbi:MAG: exo-alpha-sialidase [Sedimentisphaerales bacterium]|nr:exo-alpha-sialidase [Sedimentisphaerales bacterium]